MPPSRPKSSSKSKFAPEDEIKLFASSKRGPEVKIKPTARPRLETGSPSISQTPMKGTLEEAMELSDSGAEAPRGPSKLFSKSRVSAEHDMDSGVSSNLPSIRGLNDVPEANADLVDIMSQHSKSSSKSTSIRKNTAKCSRGKKSARMRPSITHADIAIRKVSAFKPMKTNGQTSSSSIVKRVEAKIGKDLDEESTSERDFEPDTTGDTDMTYETLRSDKLDSSKESLLKKIKSKAFVTDESDAEEFHELSDFRRSESGPREEVRPAAVKKSPVKKKISKSKEASLTPSEEDQDSASYNDDPVITSLINPSSKESTPRARHSPAIRVDYITREEFEITIKRLKEDWKDEMQKMQTAMRLETKRLIRSEVKDEILISQSSS